MEKIHITFNDENEGLVTEEVVKKLFHNTHKIVGVKEGFCSIVPDPIDPSTKVLQVKFPKGIIQEEKTRWRYVFEKSFESVTLTYKVMFKKDFDFVRGGKLPGLYGGTAPRGGMKSDGSDGFSARIMWREKGEIFQYMYWKERAPTKKWGDDLPWVDIEGDMKPFCFVPGIWHTLETQITLNTPGERDGNITSWFDDKLALSTVGEFRAKGATFGVDSFAFTTFFGGNDETWAPTKDEFVYFGDIDLSLNN